jgi:hypothetical protein
MHINDLDRKSSVSMSSTISSKCARISDDSRNTTSTSAARFGGSKPANRDIRPSDVHELRMEVLRVQNQTRLQRTNLNRLKARILRKTEAINRTVQPKGGEEVLPKPASTLSLVQRSVDGAEHALEDLHRELEEARLDDRTAYYQEVEEELRATYLEYDRIQDDVAAARDQAQMCEAQLRDVDYKASPAHADELKKSISQLKAYNRSLRAKWTAYHVKMEKIQIDCRIDENRRSGRPAQETIEAAPIEYGEEVDRVSELTEQLETADTEYRTNLEKLNTILDGQRKRIVEHLMEHRA